MSVSIVIPVRDSETEAEDCLRSLVDQQYPDLEVIVERHPSAACAVNNGLKRAKGAVLGCLMPGEMLLPRVLHSVAASIAPGLGRNVVMGRAIYLPQQPQTVAVEFPREYRGHADHLAIWKRGFDTVPRSSVFWHRSVWDLCGPVADHGRGTLDYDMICRMGMRHSIHQVDEIWSAIDFETPFAEASIAEFDRVEVLTRVSRAYWGPWISPLRWQCVLSHWRYRHSAHDVARHHARRGEAAADEGSCVRAFAEFARTWLLSPAMAKGRWKKCRARSRKLPDQVIT